MNQITYKGDLEDALGAERFLLFKHSLVCPVSTRAFAEYERFAAQSDVPTGWIDVIGQRDWSHLVEKKTGVVHQSPQALYIRDSLVVWPATHFKITAAALAEATA